MTARIDGTHRGRKTRDAGGLVVSTSEPEKRAGRKARHARSTLAARRKDFDALPVGIREARRRPGSLQTAR